MTKAELIMLKAAYPKTNIEKTKLVRAETFAGNITIHYMNYSYNRSVTIKMRKFVMFGKHRYWTMRIGRRSRKLGKDIIVYGAFRSERLSNENL